MMDVRRAAWAAAIAYAAWAGLAAGAADARAQRPLAATGPASNVAQTTAVLNGTVAPRGAATTYVFRYGPTPRLGTSTAPATVPAGRRARISVAIAGLVPAQRYHYRLVARNGRGVAHGRLRTFRTPAQPLGATLGAIPNPVRPGAETLLAGNVTGTGSAGRQVVLQANPYPYSGGFRPLGNPQVTAADGGFMFGVLSVPLTTQFRVVVRGERRVVSPVVVVGAKVRVGTSVDVDRGRRHGHVELAGRVQPAVDGARVAVEKLRDGVWRTVGESFARPAGDGASRYRVRLHQRRGGTYRVLVEAEGAYVANRGREIAVPTRRLRR